MLDPNAAATLTLDEIDALCDELTRAHGDALPRRVARERMIEPPFVAWAPGPRQPDRRAHRLQRRPRAARRRSSSAIRSRCAARADEIVLSSLHAGRAEPFAADGSGAAGEQLGALCAGGRRGARRARPARGRVRGDGALRPSRRRGPLVVGRARGRRRARALRGRRRSSSSRSSSRSPASAPSCAPWACRAGSSTRPRACSAGPARPSCWTAGRSSTASSRVPARRALAILDSGVERSLETSAYAERRAELEEAMRTVGAERSTTVAATISTARRCPASPAAARRHRERAGAWVRRGARARRPRRGRRAAAREPREPARRLRGLDRRSSTCSSSSRAGGRIRRASPRRRLRRVRARARRRRRRRGAGTGGDGRVPIAHGKRRRGHDRTRLGRSRDPRPET